MRQTILAACAVLAACNAPSGNQRTAETAATERVSVPAASASAPQSTDPTPLSPPEPGQPGGLPDDGTPVSEAPFEASSAQGAADIVQRYFALLEAGEIADAIRLRRAGTVDPTAFPRGFGKYQEYHARIGAPGKVEGAAGLLFVEVPVQIYGRLASGVEVNKTGAVRLKRSNDVPRTGSDQLEWRITSAEPLHLLD